MATLELKAYEILKSKFGVEEAEVVIEYIEHAVEKSVNQNVKLLATKEDTGKLNQDLTTTTSALRTEIAATRAELKTEIATTKSELKAEIAATKAELKVEIAMVKSELLRAVYVVGLVQFLAIVGSVIAIINFLGK